MSTTQTTVAQAAGAILDQQYPLPDTSAHALPSTPNCKRIRLMAPVDSTGAATNTGPVFFGDSANQRDWIAADGSRDTFVHIDDASKIFVKGTSADKINYRVEW